MLKRLLLVLLLNFTALFVGSLLMRNPATNTWYQTLQKAPWTHPGGVFGAAWFSIMILFAIFITKVWILLPKKSSLIGLYLLQWIFNISWNPFFFRLHQIEISFFILILLLLSLIFIWRLVPASHLKLRWYLLPYMVWMLVAISLNGYIWIFN